MESDNTDVAAVRVRGDLDSPSRWMWIVKWILAIPHYVVLAFLDIALVVLTVVAGFAILFTGRYPRALFDFNLGVLRWNWRVSYYTFPLNGTDKYPPFSLSAKDEYPADFTIEYPESLTNWAVLVKWWLLAIPQLFILYAMRMLVLTGAVVAAVALLFTETYPPGLHDLLMGLNRYRYRVATYVALLRDEYPPFRLDQGGGEI